MATGKGLPSFQGGARKSQRRALSRSRGAGSEAGHRVYFGQDGAVLVILLQGGTKKRQQREVETAKALWADYKRRRPRMR